MSYKKLEIWQIARKVSIEVHYMTINILPKFEMYEEGAQIRRSSKSIRSNIVEGYGRRHYKKEFLKFLYYAHSSCDETIDHLEILYETKSLENKQIFECLLIQLNELGAKLNRFIKSVRSSHQSVMESIQDYGNN